MAKSHKGKKDYKAWEGRQKRKKMAKNITLKTGVSIISHIWNRALSGLKKKNRQSVIIHCVVFVMLRPNVCIYVYVYVIGKPRAYQRASFP